jgi:Prolipoprotein diacylglyceryl transferase
MGASERSDRLPARSATTVLPSRCAHPTLGARKISTYTVLGFTGYAIASLGAAILMFAWELPLGDRLIAAFAPPIAFLVVVTIARQIVGYERIVFYQTAVAGVLATALVSVVAGAHTARLLDVATLGIGGFLVFGRIGCFAVACCHGRPARVGIVYGPEHVAVGLFPRWSGRRLWPVQLVESAASLGFVIVALVVGWEVPGAPACIYIVGYALVRFALEIVRGDPARPYAYGISEAQWIAAASAAICAVWFPGALTIVCAAALALALVVLAARHAHRAPFLPPHLREIDRLCTDMLANLGAGHRETSLGVSLSCHRLPDGRLDWIVSSKTAWWSTAAARRLAGDLWSGFELVEGRVPGLVHVIVSA